MTLETLQREMVAAMKNHDKQRKDTISALISAAKKTAIDEKVKPMGKLLIKLSQRLLANLENNYV